jgi:hypothetical protein
MSTPLPGETLAIFYSRSREFSPICTITALYHLRPSMIGEYWTQKAHGTGSDNRGKQLRRDGFTLAEERYGEQNSTRCLLNYALM